MPNALIHEKSLYLRQHADQPVDWLPWGEEAFALARQRNVPVLVSVGYSTCHWCHVMARESFSDPYIADLMNRNFVCVKVDREERPDVDKLCMDAVQMILGHGGWPLNVFFLPDGRPFFGGTYFPPTDRGQRIIPWPQLLMRIADHFQRSPKELADNAAAILQNLAHADGADQISPATTSTAAPDLFSFAEQICASHDPDHGGFGGAPKFPQPVVFQFLLALLPEAQKQRPALAEKITRITRHSLHSMARGALLDQLGGGFFRYCIDARWQVPHFEKMLCDNALLLETFARAAVQLNDPFAEQVAHETVRWLLSVMRQPSGAFSAALDADTNHREGITYLWTPEEIAVALGDTAAAAEFCHAYGIDEKGNFDRGVSTPTFADGDLSLREKFRLLREKLLQFRNRRPQPDRDDKVLLGWNALAVRALALAGWALHQPEWTREAARTADFLWETFLRADGSLAAVAYDGQPSPAAATLNDCAWLADAELTLAATADWAFSSEKISSGEKHRERAQHIGQHILDHFADPTGQPGFFLTDTTVRDLPLRQKEWFDNATPAANAILPRVFATLLSLTGENRWADAHARLAGHYRTLLQAQPSSALAASGESLIRPADNFAILKIFEEKTNWPNWHPHLRLPVLLHRLLPVHEPATNGFQLCHQQSCSTAKHSLPALLGHL